MSKQQVCFAAAFSSLIAQAMWAQAAAPSLSATDARVGQHLQAPASVAVNTPIPRMGLKVKITSNDPARLLLAPMPDAAGSPSIEVNIQGGIREPEFFVQALDKSGTATYTATAPGLASATGKVTMAPSGIVVGGPYGVGKETFLITTGVGKTKVGLYSALLDSSLNFVAVQPVAGGRSVKAKLSTSNAAAGKLAATDLTITGGSSSAVTYLQPGTPGDTTLSTIAPAGFSTPIKFTALTAKVVTPGLALADEIYVGQNLQSGGNLSLGEAAPPGGLEVTIISEDPSKVLLSQSLDQVGTATLKIKVPEGGTGAKYYLQGLVLGTVKYHANAPGYKDRTATITVVPAGVVITGPLSITRAGGSPGFVASIASGKPTDIVLFTAYLDPVSHRSADVTVQPLRAGVDLNLNMTSSDPEVGTIVTPVVLKAGTDTVNTVFKPLKPGRTTVSVVTPPGYTSSANATTLKVIVTE